MFKKYAKFLHIPLLLAISLFLTLQHRDIYDWSISPEAPPLAEAAQPEDGGYDLSSLHVLNSVLLLINQCYVEPERMDPQKMLRSALKGIEDEVPDIIVTFSEDGNQADIKVDTAHKTFAIGDIDSPWSMSEKLSSIFQFIQKTLKNDEIELPDVEYAAVNGMLGTLDPHTRLLTPEYYSEMKLDTQGEFGGLGIVISSPEGSLTINEVIAGTPAQQNGLECGDRIVQIEEESTVNMDVTEAVKLLRGKSGSTVTVWIMREGFKNPKPVEIERAIIHIDSVHSDIIAGDVGYIRLTGFQENTYEDLRIHLQKLKKQGMTRLVLDLRDNPGGLLEQSKHIADVFLFAGNIVTTWVPCDRNPKDTSSAHVSGTESNYPILVLINRGSASASEIVAGALKNHDRALIVGEQSFGKGSIQQLKELGDGSALKYTIGKYLTPGDVSIQATGITPDIQLTPMFVEEDSMDIFALDDVVLRESDLEQSLHSDKVSDELLPVEELEYVYVKPGKKDGKCPPRVEEIVHDDWEVKAAARMLKSVSSTSRPKMIQQLADTFEQIRLQQDQKLVKELKKLKINWEVCGESPPGEVEDLEITYLQDGKKVDAFRAEAGSTTELTVTVQNRSKTGTFCRLYGMTKSDNTLLTGREMLIGKLKPGQKRSWTETIKIPRRLPSRVDPIEITFHEQRGMAPPPEERRMTILGLEEPSYAASWQVLDDMEGDGDGVLERGETARLRLYVKNTGSGKSVSTAASIKNLSGKALYIQKGREEIKDLDPGEQAHVDFKLKLTEGYDADAYQLRLTVVDVDRAVMLMEKIELDAVRAQDDPVGEESSVLTVAVDQAAVLPLADASVAMLASLPQGTQLKITARSGSLVRVQLPDEGWGWMKSSDLEEGGKKPTAELDKSLAVSWALDLPVITFQGFDPEVGLDGDWTVRGETLVIQGQATDQQIIKDMHIYLGNEKVYYKSNPHQGEHDELDFEVTLSLEPGVNYLLVTVRESPLLMKRKLLVIRRDKPDGSTMETPDKKLIP